MVEYSTAYYLDVGFLQGLPLCCHVFDTVIADCIQSYDSKGHPTKPTPRSVTRSMVPCERFKSGRDLKALTAACKTTALLRISRKAYVVVDDGRVRDNFNLSIFFFLLT